MSAEPASQTPRDYVLMKRGYFWRPDGHGTRGNRYVRLPPIGFNPPILRRCAEAMILIVLGIYCLEVGFFRAIESNRKRDWQNAGCLLFLAAIAVALSSAIGATWEWWI